MAIKNYFFDFYLLIVEEEAGPAVEDVVGFVGEAKGTGDVENHGDVLFVEAAQYHLRTGGEGLDVGREVGGDDIAVDIGYKEIDSAYSGKKRGVAETGTDGVGKIQPDVVDSVVESKFIDFYRIDSLGAAHRGKDCKYAGACTHVDDFQAVEVHGEQLPEHKARGSMMSGAEGHLGVDDNIIATLGNILMEGTVDDTLAVDDNGFEVIFLPFAVPVASLDYSVADGKLRLHREIGENCVEFRAVIRLGPDVGGEAFFVGDKTFESLLGEQGGENIGARLVAWLEIETDFNVIVHL